MRTAENENPESRRPLTRTAAGLWTGYCLVVVALLFAIELWAPLPFAIKTLLKITLMLIPVVVVGGTYFRAPEPRMLCTALLLGVGSVLAIQGTYLALQSFIELDRVRTLLENRQNITGRIFLGVAIYVTFGNSLLEELFFRGFLVKLPLSRPWIFSSALFSVYHMTIFIGWFSWWITAIALLGLFAGGLLFCWLNGRRPTIWNSWVMHIFADVAIIVIGFQMFGYF